VRFDKLLENLCCEFEISVQADANFDTRQDQEDPNTADTADKNRMREEADERAQPSGAEAEEHNASQD
jgi:hypothetical protein